VIRYKQGKENIVADSLSRKSSLDGQKKAEFVKSLHEMVRLQIAQKNERVASQATNGRRRVIFEPRDWVWVHMRKERFPAHKKTKLHPRGDGPFQILEKINDNAYKVDLPSEYKVSATFNVSDLSPFDVGEDSWSNPFEERKLAHLELTLFVTDVGEENSAFFCPSGTYKNPFNWPI
jgi:hypothetical protein